MNTLIHLEKEIHQPILKTEDFPPYKPCKNGYLAFHIAGHMKLILEENGLDGQEPLRLPAIIELADFYQCTIKDVLDALHILHLQCYKYRISALDTAVVLLDPLNRQKSWQPTQKAG